MSTQRNTYIDQLSAFGAGSNANLNAMLEVMVDSFRKIGELNLEHFRAHLPPADVSDMPQTPLEQLKAQAELIGDGNEYCRDLGTLWLQLQRELNAAAIKQFQECIESAHDNVRALPSAMPGSGHDLERLLEANAQFANAIYRPMLDAFQAMMTFNGAAGAISARRKQQSGRHAGTQHAAAA